VPGVVDAVPVAVDQDAAEIFALEVLVQDVVAGPAGFDAEGGCSTDRPERGELRRERSVPQTAVVELGGVAGGGADEPAVLRRKGPGWSQRRGRRRASVSERDG
jgi:hypothetical protein